MTNYTILQDLRYAVRRLRRSPAFTLTVVLTLAVGIGAATAMFSVVDATVLEPLPYPDAARIVRVRETTPEGQPFPLSEPDYLEFARSLRTVRGLAAIKPVQRTMTGAGEPMRVEGTAASADLFPLLGITAEAGGVFSRDDDRDGRAAHVVLISHALWHQRFGGRADAVGRSIRLDGDAYTVAGVLPASVAFPPSDIWIPLGASSSADRTDKWLDAIGRLAPGASLSDARAEAAVVAARLAQDRPESRGWSAQVSPFTDWIIGPGLRRMVWVLLGAVALLLLIACANAGSLLMTRAADRRVELGVRAALGAARGRLVRQLMTETALIAIAGGALGLVVARWMLDALSVFLAGLLPAGRVAAIDFRALSFAVAAMIVTAAAVGIAPAVRAADLDVQAALRGSSRSATSGGRRWADVLVGMQLAVATVLLVGAFLLMGSFSRLTHVDPGFSPGHILTLPLDLPDDTYPEAARAEFFRRAIASIMAVPGVESAAATATDPFRQWGFANDVTPEERAADAPPSGFMQAGWRSVTAGYFATLQVPLDAGRAFTTADGADAPPVAVVSQGLARRLWPGQSALGHRLYWGGVYGTPRTVVGIVGDVRDVRLEAPPIPMLYLAHDQVPLGGMTLLVRTRPGVAGVATALRERIRDLDPLLPVPEPRPLAANLETTLLAPEFRLVLLAVFGGFALLLASVGVYALVAFTVAQRTREIAIRMALGAAPAQVAALFFRRGLRLTMAGGLAGLAGAWALAGVLASLLYETEARDPALFGAAAALLSLAALLASYLPARRAARLDPLPALGVDG